MLTLHIPCTALLTHGHPDVTQICTVMLTLIVLWHLSKCSESTSKSCFYRCNITDNVRLQVHVGDSVWSDLCSSDVPEFRRTWSEGHLQRYCRSSAERHSIVQHANHRHCIEVKTLTLNDSHTLKTIPGLLAFSVAVRFEEIYGSRFEWHFFIVLVVF